MKLFFITAQTPWGRGETFILEEMLEVKRQGVDLLIVPRNPSKEVFHEDSKELLENTFWSPVTNLKIINVFLSELLTKISLWRILLSIIQHSRGPWVLLKNLAVFPKSIVVARVIKKEGFDHIHAHWGSTTATMGYVISKITGIPWSFTLHRWDIKENNMLKEKAKSARFVRCISEYGKNELIEITGREYQKKIKVIHMGVKIPENISEFQKTRELFTIVVPANLLEVKGHKYLVEACSILVKESVRNFQCIFYGDGPFRAKLGNLIEERALTNYMKIPGVIPHKKLIEMYKNRKVDLVVLPSINTKKGEHEGIPVSLMEAMAYGIPVISTNTGSIPKLLSDGAGIMVQEKSSTELAEAILKLVNDEDLTLQIAIKEYNKISREFNVENTTEKLLRLISRDQV